MEETKELIKTIEKSYKQLIHAVEYYQNQVQSFEERIKELESAKLPEEKLAKIMEETGIEKFGIGESFFPKDYPGKERMVQELNSHICFLYYCTRLDDAKESLEECQKDLEQIQKLMDVANSIKAEI